MRCLVAWLLLGSFTACAGAKDMSQRSGPPSAQRAEPSAAEVSDAPAVEVASREPIAGTEASPASADAAERSDATQSTPAAVQPAAPAKVPPAQLLGRKQAEIEARLGPLQFAEGWARPADGALALQFRGGRCVGLRGHVPEDMDCAAVPAWLGFDAATFPLRRSDRCEWPGISLKHRLAEGVAGSYVPATREYALGLRR